MRPLGLVILALICLSQHSEGIKNKEIIQKWNVIQDKLPAPWNQLFKDSLKTSEDEVDTCGTCQSAVTAVKLAIIFIPNFEAIRDPIYEACKVIISALQEGADAETTCNVVDTQGPPIFDIIKDSAATAEKICRNVNLCFDPREETVVPRTERKPLKSTKAKNESKVKKTGTKGKRGKAGVVKVAQLADIHVDPEHAIGSPTDCGLLVCCRDHYSGTGSAGAYGTYMCNTPQRTLELFLQKVKDLNPDIVVHTGDNPTHHMWAENREESLQCSEIAYSSIGKILKGTPVYCALGNHEAYPTNLYNPENEMTQDLLRRMVDWWAPLADLGEEQRSTILRGALYTTPSPVEGLRILSINSNFWYAFNFYNILLEGSEEELYVKQFVEETFANARAAGEKVLVLLHHPQGDPDNIVNHARWYRQIVAEYSDVILFGLSGHTHYDELKLYRDPSTGDANSVVFVAPSMTSMSSSNIKINPSVRLFTLDAETFELLEIEQYNLDLSDVNNENPEVQLIYRFTEEYDLPDASVSSVAQLFQRLGEDQDYFNKWRFNKYTRGPNDGECIEECRDEQLCSLNNVVYDEYLECVNDAQLKREELQAKLMKEQSENKGRHTEIHSRISEITKPKHNKVAAVNAAQLRKEKQQAKLLKEQSENRGKHTETHSRISEITKPKHDKVAAVNAAQLRKEKLQAKLMKEQSENRGKHTETHSRISEISKPKHDKVAAIYSERHRQKFLKKN